MSTLTSEFLALKRIAVAGVSREPATHGANVVYRRFKERGYAVFPVNPNAERVEGDTCYPDLRSIPDGVEGVVIGTPASATGSVVRECKELGIKFVWMHQGPAPGSVSLEAVRYCRENGIAVIPGGCPCMFGATSDGAHKAMRFILQLTGAVPRGI
jgi:uncharacterized protein